MKSMQKEPKKIEFERADTEGLAGFDPSTKRCTMNCNPHRLDPRTSIERRYLCDDCEQVK